MYTTRNFINLQQSCKIVLNLIRLVTWNGFEHEGTDKLTQMDIIIKLSLNWIQAIHWIC